MERVRFWVGIRRLGCSWRRGTSGDARCKLEGIGYEAGQVIRVCSRLCRDGASGACPWESCLEYLVYALGGRVWCPKGK
jgi:hypothetical protein